MVKFSISFFCILISLQTLLASQPSARIMRYDVTAEINDRKSEMKAEAHVWVQLLRDSVDRIVFTFPENFDFDVARDSTGKKYDRKKIPSPRGNGFQDIAFLLSDTLRAHDSVFIALTYEAQFDTASTAELFINTHEILLQVHDVTAWVPLLSPSMNTLQDYFIASHLNLTLPSEWRLFANGTVDTLQRDEEKISFRVHVDKPVTLEAAFLVYASKQAIEKKYFSHDSTVSITIVSDTVRFHPEFRDALGTFMNSAHMYFSKFVPCSPLPASLQFFIAGSDDGEHVHTHIGANTIVRSMPQFAVVDSTPFRSFLQSRWIQSIAAHYLSNNNDSLAWFRKGLSEYLAARFFFDSILTTTEQQQQKRYSMMARTLDFYTLPSVLDSHNARAIEDRVAQKLRYVFLMLEYVMSRELFDAALHNCLRSAEVTFSPRLFQRECEQIYGSSLDWFFQEWIAQTNFPKFLFSWQSTSTQRGETAVNISIAQRGDVFAMPLDIVFTFENKTIVKRVFVENQNHEYLFSFSTKPRTVELDPNFIVLRWIPELRIQAHARTSLLFLKLNRDSAAAEQEALLTLELDPDNASGSNGLALYTLGKIAALKKEFAKAKEYFHAASNVRYMKEFSALSLFSKVRLGNVFELEDKRKEALELYTEVLHEVQQNIIEYADVERDVQKYLRKKNEVSDDTWWEQ